MGVEIGGTEGRVPRSGKLRGNDHRRPAADLKLAGDTHAGRDAEPRKFETAPRPENYPDSGSGSGSEQNVLAAPAPVPAWAPGKMYRVRRPRLRGCEVVQICDGSGPIKKIPAPSPCKMFQRLDSGSAFLHAGHKYYASENMTRGRHCHAASVESRCASLNIL